MRVSRPIPTSTGRLASVARVPALRSVRASAGKLISKAEVPAFIPRDDLIDQMCTWAEIEAAGNGARNFGMPMKVERIWNKVDDADMLWGFKIALMRGGTHVCDLGFQFDKEVQSRHQYINKNSEGFPEPGGKSSEVVGKNFEIWKLDDKPVDAEAKQVIKRVCVSAAQAMNKYYTFGSVFSEDL